jgi:hypothetical protein
MRLLLIFNENRYSLINQLVEVLFWQVYVCLVTIFITTKSNEEELFYATRQYSEAIV